MQKKQQIMIVDDEPHIVAAIKTVLEVEGYKVIEAFNGQEALKKLRKGKLPDLILIDMFMPKMSGRNLCEEIRKDKKLKNLKVIFVTVATFSETGRKTLEHMHVLDYITKPLNNEDLVWRVKRVLEN